MTQPYHILPRAGSSMAEEWLDLGLNHHVAGRFPEAETAYLRGLRVDPNCTRLITNLGVLAAMQGQMIPSLQYFERALLFEETPQCMSVVWFDYALALLEVGRPHDGLPAIEESLKLGESGIAFAAKGMILTSCGRAKEAIAAYDKAMDIEPAHQLASYNAMFARTLVRTPPKDHYEARKRWHAAHAFKGEKKPHDNDKSPDRPLRVGYVGGDFKMHSAAFIFSSVVLRHDKEKFEPFCYMTMKPDPMADTVTKRFAENTTMRDVSATNDDGLEATIRQDKIDILVDLSGHTGGNRLTVFTRKAAPIQCHAWGFAHGTGCPEIDYFLADPYAIPKDEHQFFAEKIWDLPSIVGYEPPDYNQSGISGAPVARDGIFTFGVFGRFEKHSPESLEAWHKVLLRTPGSRLLVKDAMMRRPHVIQHYREAMTGIDPKRILFMQDTSHPEQMLSYQNVDLVLDTFPHTGGVTSLEILFMGVPIVTIYNGQVGGRTTSVALRAIGRQSWIANSVDEYVAKAVALSEDRAALSHARTVLRDEFLKSPLCGDTYARSVEKAYRQMWRRYCGHDADNSRDTGVATRRAADASGRVSQDDRPAGDVRKHNGKASGEGVDLPA